MQNVGGSGKFSVALLKRCTDGFCGAVEILTCNVRPGCRIVNVKFALFCCVILSTRPPTKFFSSSNVSGRIEKPSKFKIITPYRRRKTDCRARSMLAVNSACDADFKTGVMPPPLKSTLTQL